MSAAPQTDSTRDPERGRAGTGSSRLISYAIEVPSSKTGIFGSPRGNAGSVRPAPTGRDSFVHFPGAAGFAARGETCP